MLFGLGKKTPEEFWKWFEQNAADYYKFDIDDSNAHQTLSSLGKRLKAVDKNLAFEISPIENNERRLILSADGIKSVVPSVEALMQAAPKIDRWQIVAFRQRKGSKYVEFEGKRLYPGGVYFKSGHYHEGKTDIELYIKGWDSSEAMTSLGFLMLDGVLGEYDVMMRINEITWHNLAESHKKELQPIAELPKLIDSKK